MKRKDIKKVVESISNNYSLSPYQIAKNNDITIHVIDFTGMEIFDSNTSGALAWFTSDSKETKDILINSKDSINRQKFTLAHELGHYFLHKDLIFNIKIMNDDQSTILFRKDLISSLTNEEKKIEREANIFAAELLMPEIYIKKMYPEIKNISRMAKMFEVSALAMTYRLDNLGLLDSDLKDGRK